MRGMVPCRLRIFPSRSTDRTLEGGMEERKASSSDSVDIRIMGRRSGGHTKVKNTLKLDECKLVKI